MQVFSFSHRAADVTDYLLIFIGSSIPDAAEIDDAFSRWAGKNVAPPNIIVLGEKVKMRAFIAQNSTVTGILPKLERLGRHSQVILGGFDHTGQVCHLTADGSVEPNLTDEFYSAVDGFISQKIEQGDVLVPAPPGFYFDKLSGRFASHFIRAEALLESTSCIEMLALRLLKPFYNWRSRLRIHADTVQIFIDTMGVWPIAEKLVQFHRAHNHDADQITIESFRSYDGLKTWEPAQRPAFVLISATTSGGLAAEVKTILGAANAEIWTLISLSSITDRGVAKSPGLTSSDHVFALSRQLTGRPALDGLREEFESNMTSVPLGCETISIMGERFLSQSVKPKRVRLVHKSLSDEMKGNLCKIARAKAVTVARGRFDGQSRWTISFDYKKLFDMACIDGDDGRDSLLKGWLRNYSAPGPIAIIYPSSNGAAASQVSQAAKDLAQTTQDILSGLLPGIPSFQLSSSQLAGASKTPEYPLDQCSVIVVAPIIGNGFVFKQISAELRHVQPKGPRLFLALAVLPETQTHLEQLKNDISVSLDDRFYGFRYQFSFPIGRLEDAVQWERESKFLDDLEERLQEGNITVQRLNRRSKRLHQNMELEPAEVFLPPANEERGLLLSTGFFLWPGSTEISGDDYAGPVLLSIAALLQASRTAASKTDATSLKTGLFQHALLCPETFTRFNDPVIQAALLRAAYPSELNYSVSPETSRDMERLLMKWLDYAYQSAGAAVPEFLLAIATGKLKLCREHQHKVLDKACTIGGWIGVLGTAAKYQCSLH